jgi:hypothetical protein
MNHNRPRSNTHVAEEYPQIDSDAGANGGPSFMKYLFMHLGFLVEFKLAAFYLIL